MDREAWERTVEQAKTHTVVVPSTDKMVQDTVIACLEV